MRRSYRTNKEARYFGSDLNKFIHYYCSKEMDTINIDCLQYKASKQCFRVIESKHLNEKLSLSELKILRMFSKFLRFQWRDNLLPIEFFVIYADPPYRGTIKIYDIATKQAYIIDTSKLRDKRHFQRWLGFEISTKMFLKEFGYNYIESSDKE